MKKFTIGLILGVVLSVGGSVLAQGTFSPNVSGLQKLNEQQEVELGHAFSIYTGKKLETKKKVLTVEQRLSAIEARLSKLENK